MKCGFRVQLKVFLRRELRFLSLTAQGCDIREMMPTMRDQKPANDNCGQCHGHGLVGEIRIAITTISGADGGGAWSSNVMKHDHLLFTSMPGYISSRLRALAFLGPDERGRRSEN